MRDILCPLCEGVGAQSEVKTYAYEGEFTVHGELVHTTPCPLCSGSGTLASEGAADGWMG